MLVQPGQTGYGNVARTLVNGAKYTACVLGENQARTESLLEACSFGTIFDGTPPVIGKVTDFDGAPFASAVDQVWRMHTPFCPRTRRFGDAVRDATRSSIAAVAGLHPLLWLP